MTTYLQVAAMNAVLLGLKNCNKIHGHGQPRENAMKFIICPYLAVFWDGVEMVSSLFDVLRELWRP